MPQRSWLLSIRGIWAAGLRNGGDRKLQEPAPQYKSEEPMGRRTGDQGIEEPLHRGAEDARSWGVVVLRS